MHQLSEKALEAILKEWNPQEYDPPNTNIQEWTHIIESLCDTYGIPDAQRPQCAARFIESELRTELEDVLRDSRARFGPIRWVQFTNFMAAFDRDFRKTWEDLPFYERYPKLAETALGITGFALLAPVAVVGTLIAVGFASAGVAAGSIAATIQSILLLQSASATVALPLAGTIFVGTATTSTGAAVTNGESVTAGELPPDSIARGHRPDGDNDDKYDKDNDGDPSPPYHRTIPQEYLLMPQAIQAIVKSWNITTYNPPGMDIEGWLGRVHKLCEVYGVPVTQRALCAMHYMRADCREAACAAGCYDMTWDEFTTWLVHYDVVNRTSSNRRIAELLAKSKV